MLICNFIHTCAVRTYARNYLYVAREWIHTYMPVKLYLYKKRKKVRNIILMHKVDWLMINNDKYPRLLGLESTRYHLHSNILWISSNILHNHLTFIHFIFCLISSNVIILKMQAHISHLLSWNIVLLKYFVVKTSNLYNCIFYSSVVQISYASQLLFCFLFKNWKLTITVAAANCSSFCKREKFFSEPTDKGEYWLL